MADFVQSFNDIIVPFEGFYSNDPDDSAGLTIWGLQQVDDSDWSEWPTILAAQSNPGFPNNLDQNALLQSAQLYYQSKYWNPMLLGSVKYYLTARSMFNIGVNQGISTAVVFLQRILNVFSEEGSLYPLLTVDGLMGTKTINALNSITNQDYIYTCLKSLQANKYISICEKNPTQTVFINGWISRVI